ncbi:MAG: hypothetical protein NZ843_01890, partial [Fimbriimonadales bacterium]|nr:hypothetical protein [Fimbriimonadales bacterium]
MKRSLLVLGVSLLIAGQGGAQNGDWVELGPWELVERLENVQIVEVLTANDLTSAIFPPKITWQPDFGDGDFFPAAGSCQEMIYYRFATSGQYYAYESDYIVLDDALV